MRTEKYIRIINNLGVCVGYYNESEWTEADLEGVLDSSDKVEIYDENSEWVETLSGDEFLRAYM